MNIKEMVDKNTILKIRTGSKLYGTYIEGSSDIDHFGVCVPNKDYVLGTHCFELLEERTNPSSSDKRNTKFDSDYTCYSLQKYFKLLSDNNPNVIETLFVNKENIVYCNNFGTEILTHKNIFLSKRAYYKFYGYAKAQKRKLITKEPIGLRKDIVDKYTFDTKFGAHLIRLLLFGIELLDTGNIKFPTDWAKYLMQIRKGEWPLSHIIDKAAYLEEQLTNAFNHSKLPEIPDLEKINKLQIELIEGYWSNQEFKLIIPLL